MKGLMLLVSAVFHPLLMATYSCILLYFTLPSAFSPIPIEGIPFFIGTIFLTTGVIPALSVLFMKYTRRVSNLDITNIAERRLPFLMITTFYGLTTFMMYSKMDLSPFILKIMLVVTLLILMIFLVSFRFKVSVHSAATWGVAGLFSVLSIRFADNVLLILTSSLFLIAGLTSSSRLYLGRHSNREVWVGAILGFIFCFTSLLVWL